MSFLGGLWNAIKGALGGGSSPAPPTNSTASNTQPISRPGFTTIPSGSGTLINVPVNQSTGTSGGGGYTAPLITGGGGSGGGFSGGSGGGSAQRIAQAAGGTSGAEAQMAAAASSQPSGLSQAQELAASQTAEESNFINPFSSEELGLQNAISPEYSTQNINATAVPSSTKKTFLQRIAPTKKQISQAQNLLPGDEIIKQIGTGVGETLSEIPKGGLNIGFSVGKKIVGKSYKAPPKGSTLGKLENWTGFQPSEPFYKQPGAVSYGIGVATLGLAGLGEAVPETAATINTIFKGTELVGTGIGVKNIVKNPTAKTIGENIPLIVPGAVTGIKGAGSMLGRIGATEIPPEQIFNTEVLTGKNQFTMVPKGSKYGIELYKKAKVPGQQELVGTSAMGVKPGRSAVIKGGARAIEDQGLWITPPGETNVRYLRLGNEGGTKYTLNPLKTAPKSNILRLTYKDISEIPKKVQNEALDILNKQGKKSAVNFVNNWYRTQAEQGVAYVPFKSVMGNRELQALVPEVASGTPNEYFQSTEGILGKIRGYSHYTKYNGKIIPVRDVTLKFEKGKLSGDAVDSNNGKVIKLSPEEVQRMASSSGVDFENYQSIPSLTFPQKRKSAIGGTEPSSSHPSLKSPGSNVVSPSAPVIKVPSSVIYPGTSSPSQPPAASSTKSGVVTSSKKSRSSSSGYYSEFPFSSVATEPTQHPSSRNPSKSKSGGSGYDVFMKQGNHFIKINSIPLSRKNAIFKGAAQTDKNNAGEFRLRQVKANALGTLSPHEMNYAERVAYKFKQVTPNIFIEKRQQPVLYEGVFGGNKPRPKQVTTTSTKPIRIALQSRARMFFNQNSMNDFISRTEPQERKPMRRNVPKKVMRTKSKVPIWEQVA